MIYIQGNYDKTLPHHFDATCALYGALEYGQNYKLVTYEEVKEGKWDSLIKTNLFVGSVEFMREVFNRVYKLPPLIINNTKDGEEITVQQIKSNLKQNPEYKIFIKPFQYKIFPGLVIDQTRQHTLSMMPDDLIVNSYPVIEGIESEWRAYIWINQIKDIRSYSGKLNSFPKFSFIEEIMNKWSDRLLSSTYVIDVGVLNSGENFVVEFNDMWAIGNYGVENTVYYQMLRTRYFEIINS